MTKYSKYQYRQVKERRWKVHPIWRGIGLLLIIMIPLLSFFGAVMVVRQNIQQKWVQLPVDLNRSYEIPGLEIISPDLREVYTADFALTLIFMVLGFGIISILYSFVYSLFGPSRYGPVDAPPIRRMPPRKPAKMK
jgi:hypothetical protein